MSEDCCYAAARYGHLEVLKWLRENGCPWMDMVMCDAAARSGDLEVLKWVRSQGCSWDEGTCMLAAKEGHLEILKWLVEQGCPYEDNQRLYRFAASGGHLKILEWAWRPDQDTDGLWEASASGHLEVVVWLLNHGCKWQTDACIIAARNRHTHILKWIRDNGYCLGGEASYDQLFKDGQYTPYY